MHFMDPLLSRVAAYERRFGPDIWGRLGREAGGSGPLTLSGRSDFRERLFGPDDGPSVDDDDEIYEPELAALAAWKSAENVYTFSPDSLRGTDRKTLLATDSTVLGRLPEAGVLIRVPEGRLEGVSSGWVTGVIVHHTAQRSPDGTVLVVCHFFLACHSPSFHGVGIGIPLLGGVSVTRSAAVGVESAVDILSGNPGALASVERSGITPGRFLSERIALLRYALPRVTCLAGGLAEVTRDEAPDVPPGVRGYLVWRRNDDGRVTGAPRPPGLHRVTESESRPDHRRTRRPKHHFSRNVRRE